jgi:hypothetical protein
MAKIPFLSWPQLARRCWFASTVWLCTLCANTLAVGIDAGKSDNTCLFVPASHRFDGHKPTVLVVLSPRMPYALFEWRRMKALAEREGFRVIPLRDPRVPEVEWRQAWAALDDQQMADVERISQEIAAGCGLLNHTPAALVGRCGSVHPWPVLGVMPDRSWQAVLQARLAELPEVCK